jgi:hypothetical protein
MKNRLYMSLFAVAISMSCVSTFAAAPVIRDLPEINIGDNENNIGTDNNFFVYTDAFKLDDYVSDSVTPISSIIWSFDEGTGPGAAVPWFQINGIDPVLLGDGAIATDAMNGNPAHVNPTGNLRAVSNMASFRDVVLSPVSGDQPFSPNPTDLTNHAEGKAVRFYVSDGTAGNVRFTDTTVKSTDETSDSKSGGSMFIVAQDDTFTTGDPSSTGLNGWQFSTNNLSTSVYSSPNHSIGVTIATSTDKFRTGSWQANANDWLSYGKLGPDNVARAKFYMYATGQSAVNAIPNLRVRLQERFAVTDGLNILHTNNNAAQDPTTEELAPSQDPTKPSLYRVDMAPIVVPILNNGFEGIQRFWDVYGDEPQFTGTLAMCESEIGMYPRSLIDPALVTPGKTYVGSDLWHYFSTDQQMLTWVVGTTDGAYPTAGTGPFPTITESAAGVTLDTTAVPTTQVGNPIRDFNPPQDYNDFPSLVRVVENKQWTVRWHMTSTKACNRQSHMRLIARSIGFGWSHQYEMGGAWVGSEGNLNGRTNNQIAQQTLPGVGCDNPDQMTPGENGGWYTQILHTPMSQDIRPDVPGTTIAAKMPLISALPGPGVNSFVAGKDRAWRFSTDMLDTISQGELKTLEEGNVLIDRLELRQYDLVNDN